MRNLWDMLFIRVKNAEPEMAVAAPDSALPLDWRAIPSTVVPSSRAINELLDTWRARALAAEAALPNVEQPDGSRWSIRVIP